MDDVLTLARSVEPWRAKRGANNRRAKKRLPFVTRWAKRNPNPSESRVNDPPWQAAAGYLPSTSANVNWTDALFVSISSTVAGGAPRSAMA